jgi:hypothetical protein
MQQDRLGPKPDLIRDPGPQTDQACLQVVRAAALHARKAASRQTDETARLVGATAAHLLMTGGGTGSSFVSGAGVEAAVSILPILLKLC